MGAPAVGNRIFIVDQLSGSMNPFKRIALIFVAATTLGILSALPPTAQAQNAEALDKKIVELNQTGKYSEAVPLAQQALAIREKALGPDHPDVAEALNTLAQLYVRQGRYAEAEPLYKRALAIREKALGPDDPNVVSSYNSLADLYRAQGRHAESEQLRLKSRAIMETSSRERATARQQDRDRQRDSDRRRDWDGESPAKVEAKEPPAAAATPPSASPKDTQFATRSAPTRSMRTPPAGTAPPAATAAAPSPAPPSVSSLSSSVTPAQTLPDFPWPPPEASATYVLPRELLASRATVGQVSDAIISALERTGYTERSFFRTQVDGVALVTQLERINDDGTARAEGERWPAGLQNNQSSASLGRFLQGLFYVDRGRYRVIVFILQDRPFVQSSDKITGQQARDWIRTGANVLPPEVRNRSFSEGTCSVLVYEFESDGAATKPVASHLTGKQHLEKAGVMAYLAKAN
jgi:Tetratricopeptide repeat